MAMINPGAANAALYDRFRARHRRDPRPEEVGQFKGAFNWDWNSDIEEGELNRGLGAIDAYTDPLAAPPPPPAATTPAKSWTWNEVPEAPGFDGSEFEMPEFTAPGAEGMYADPGYQFRMSQGLKALEATKAGAGKYLTGETMRDVMTYGQGMGSQEYGNVFNRAVTAHNLNRGVREHNLGIAQAEYAPGLATWDARTNAMLDRDNLGFDRDWQREVYYNDDAFRKAVFASDDEFRRAVQAEQNAWKREMLIEERLRWLATTGRG